MDILKKYLDKPTVSVEEAEVNVTQDVVTETTESPVIPTITTEVVESYEPLSQERIAELVSQQPKPENKLDLSAIKSRIAKVEFTNLEREIHCAITMDNGFRCEGSAFVADKENHIEELGRHYAYEKAFAKLVPIATFLWMDSMKPTVSNEEGVVEEAEIKHSEKLKEDVPEVDGVTEVTASLEGIKGGLLGFLIGTIAWPAVGPNLVAHAAVKAHRMKLRDDIEKISKRIAQIRNNEIDKVKGTGVDLPKNAEKTDWSEVIKSAFIGAIFSPLYGVYQGSELEDLNNSLQNKLKELEGLLAKEGLDKYGNPIEQDKK